MSGFGFVPFTDFKLKFKILKWTFVSDIHQISISQLYSGAHHSTASITIPSRTFKLLSKPHLHERFGSGVFC